eukprot:gnl/TRDRNA2_/TRDRNA2_188947_c0_seq1.p1 gnl/TRDRNA2_/TRDRNA2_188947_c0~~gnl/TRDRNA2_/TRDRNA2_188947_c0_seq1.p1  ORF type:complete len:195 (+),score=67.06 gnl/TRDRNA2_/TRDRNA2_188947_c0_seq1:112-696(+)
MAHMDALDMISDDDDDDEDKEPKEAVREEEAAVDEDQASNADEPATKKQKVGFGNDYFKALVAAGPQVEEAAEEGEGSEAADAKESPGTVGFQDLLRAGYKLGGDEKGKGKKGRGKKKTVDPKENWVWGRGDGNLGKAAPRGGRGAAGGSGGRGGRAGLGSGQQEQKSEDTYEFLAPDQAKKEAARIFADKERS